MSTSKQKRVNHGRTSWTNADENHFLENIGTFLEESIELFDRDELADRKIRVLGGYIRSLKNRKYFGRLERGFCEKTAERLLKWEIRKKRDRERHREKTGCDWIVEGKVML